MACSSPTKSQPYSLGPDNTPVGREIDMWRRLISPEKPKKKKNNAAPRKRIGEYAEHKAWFEQRFGQRIVSNVDTNSNELGRVEPTSNEEDDTEGLGNDIEGDCDQSSDLEDTALPGSDDTVTDVHRRVNAPSLSGTLEDVDNDPTSDVVNSSDDDDSGYDTPKYAAPSVHSRCNVDSGYDYGKSDASEDSDDEEESDSSGNSDEEKVFDSSEDSDSNDEESD